MTSYRFRMKFASDPTALWRDIAIGGNRTIEEFQTVLNDSVGLDQGHLWFFGSDQDYWRSDVLYRRPGEIDLAPSPPLSGVDEYDAAEATMSKVVRRLDLSEGDRLCYVYDYGDEWRFYGILKEIDESAPDDREPAVVKQKGDPIDQYAGPENAH